VVSCPKTPRRAVLPCLRPFRPQSLSRKFPLSFFQVAYPPRLLLSVAAWRSGRAPNAPRGLSRADRPEGVVRPWFINPPDNKEEVSL
jgi:hypothetical protein